MRGRRRGVGSGAGASARPVLCTASCVPPPGAQTHLLQSGVPARRELSVQNRPRCGPCAPAVAAVAPALGRRVSGCLLWTLPSGPARPPTQAVAGGPPAEGQVRGSRSRPGRAPSSGQTAACYSVYRPSWCSCPGRALTPGTQGLIAPRALSSRLQRRDGSARAPRSESCPPAVFRVGASLSLGSGAQRPGRLRSPRGARPSLLPAAEVGRGRRSQGHQLGPPQPQEPRLAGSGNSRGGILTLRAFPTKPFCI